MYDNAMSERTSHALIFLTTICTVASQLLLKRGLSSAAGLAATDKIAFLAFAAMSPYVLASLTLQVIGYVSWFFVITQVKLAVAVAIAGSLVYVLMALAAWCLFEERLSTIQWLGIGLITVGVLCMAHIGK